MTRKPLGNSFDTRVPEHFRAIFLVGPSRYCFEAILLSFWLLFEAGLVPFCGHFGVRGGLRAFLRGLVDKWKDFGRSWGDLGGLEGVLGGGQR